MKIAMIYAAGTRIRKIGCEPAHVRKCHLPFCHKCERNLLPRGCVPFVQHQGRVASAVLKHARALGTRKPWCEISTRIEAQRMHMSPCASGYFTRTYSVLRWERCEITQTYKGKEIKCSARITPVHKQLSVMRVLVHMIMSAPFLRGYKNHFSSNSYAYSVFSRKLV